MRTLLALLLATFLCGCAATVRSDISAINQLPMEIAGKTYFVGKFKDQEGSLEYQRYADLISAELDTKGLRPAPTFEAADLLVFFRYGLEQRTELVPTPIWGQTGYQPMGTVVTSGGRSVFVPTYGMPIYGVTGVVDMPTPMNRRTLNLDVLDKTSTAEKPVKLYESTVQSTGYSGLLLQVMPSMIKALFTRWPGPPTRIETLDTPLPRTQ
jgi:hypothetical protein